MSAAQIAKKIERAAEVYMDAMMLILFSIIVTAMVLGLLALIVFGVYSAVTA